MTRGAITAARRAPNSARRVGAGLLGTLFVLCPLVARSAPPAAQEIVFSGACDPGERLRIAAVGDLLYHGYLQKQALAEPGGFAAFWRPVEHVLRSADIAYGNLEGPAARNVLPGGRDRGGKSDGTERVYDRVVYAGGEDDVLVFNFHPSAVADIKAGGMSIVSTANNHAADRGVLGIERTIDELRRADLAFVGTRTRADRDEGRPWRTVTRANRFDIAWIACTFGLNGIPDPERLVLSCYERDGTPNAELLDAIRAALAEPGVDAVILTPHWGNEYQQQPATPDRRLAREAIAAGATAVIGAHPHVLQPWEKIVAPDGREGLAIYSLGNFISAQFGAARRASAIALLELTRGPDGRSRFSAVGFVPTWVAFGKPYQVVENAGGKDGEIREGLELTLRLLLALNRVKGGEPTLLRRDCRSAPPSK